VGGERFNFFTGCKAAKSVTILLRGGAEQFIDEAERSLQDAILSTRRLVKNPSIVAGGGAIEMASRGIYGKQQLLVAAYAKALEVIPRQVAENGGLDATDILNKLRQKHAQGHTWFGVDVNEGDVCDTYEAYVWEAACLILSVDETVRNPQSEQPNTAQHRCVAAGGAAAAVAAVKRALRVGGGAGGGAVARHSRPS
ncbi:TCP-1/cpn60 chaperonin family-domain-containing protein, partial [Pavlovales sp. CCMP2436]